MAGSNPPGTAKLMIHIKVYHYVYRIENLLDGKIYVGKHSTEDLEDGYMGSGTLLIRAIKKHGIENFRKHIIKMCETSEEAFEIERQVVNEQFVADENTYNMTTGGLGGPHNKSWWTNHPEKRAELSKVMSVRMTKLHADRNAYVVTCDWTGRRHTLETRNKMSVSHRHKHNGEKNSQHGTIWILNDSLKISRKIKKDEFEQFAADGWIKGRKINW